MYVSCPKDLTKVKSKLFAGLTKRQLVCFSIGAVVGLPVFFLTRNVVGNSTAMLLMMALAAPSFILAMYERDGMPAEKILRNMLRSCWFFPVKRPYKTENIYAWIDSEIKKEALVAAETSIKADKTGKTAGAKRKAVKSQQKGVKKGK